MGNCREISSIPKCLLTFVYQFDLLAQGHVPGMYPKLRVLVVFGYNGQMYHCLLVQSSSSDIKQATLDPWNLLASPAVG